MRKVRGEPLDGAARERPPRPGARARKAARKTERKPELSFEEKERLRQEKKDAKVTPRLAAQTCNPAEAGLQPCRGSCVTL